MHEATIRSQAIMIDALIAHSSNLINRIGQLEKELADLRIKEVAKGQDAMALSQG
jgi:hypothetical protein